MDLIGCEYPGHQRETLPVKFLHYFSLLLIAQSLAGEDS